MRPRSPVLVITMLCAAAACFAASACGGNAPPAAVDAGGADANHGPDASDCPAPGGAVCNFFTSCGCNVPTDKCGLGLAGAVCDLAGAKTEGMLCAGDTDCAAGLACVTYAGAAVCKKFCDDAHACPTTPTEEACYIRVVDNATPPNQIASVCGPVCSLLDQDCPGATLGCYQSMRVTEMEKGICITAGTKVQGEICTHSNDCAAGYLCITPSGATQSTCDKICDLVDHTPACDVGTCTGLPGETRTGVCLTP